MSDYKNVLPDWFKIYPHQQNMWKFIYNMTLKGEKNLEGFFSWSRRMGKDVSIMALFAVMMRIRPGRYFHVMRTFEDARRNLWLGVLSEPAGVRYIELLGDLFNKDAGIKVIEKNMTVTLPNGSQYMLVGADKPNKLRGAGVMGVGFSESEFYTDSEVFKIVGPMLGQTGGWRIHISTPSSDGNPGQIEKHNIRERYEKGEQNTFFEKLTKWDCEKISGCSFISDEFIKNEELKYGKDYVLREYACAEGLASENTFYGDLISEMEKDNRITHVPYDPERLVNTAWDIGRRDPTCIIYFQMHGDKINIIDCDEFQDSLIQLSLERVKNKPYYYGHHLAPWDVESSNTVGAPSMVALENNVHLKKVHTNTVGKMVGINMARTIMPRVYIDKDKCKALIRGLRGYKKKLNAHGVHAGEAVHDLYSHSADAYRTLAVGINEYGLHGIISDNKQTFAYGTPQSVQRNFRQQKAISTRPRGKNNGKFI